jgi:flagellum-specific peptidoglycan hydrolase FlgJ
MPNERQKENLKKIVYAAIMSEVETGCPAELTTAQCILESGWLEHAPGNNPFGIKFNPSRHKRFTSQSTKEYLADKGKVHMKDRFAAYECLEEAFVDHALLLTSAPRYKKHFISWRATKDFKALVSGIAGRLVEEKDASGKIIRRRREGGYATDPDYPRKVLSVLTPFVVGSITKIREGMGLLPKNEPGSVAA